MEETKSTATNRYHAYRDRYEVAADVVFFLHALAFYSIAVRLLIVLGVFFYAYAESPQLSQVSRVTYPDTHARCEADREIADWKAPTVLAYLLYWETPPKNAGGQHPINWESLPHPRKASL